MSGRNKKPYHALRVPSCPCGGHVVIKSLRAVKRAYHIKKIPMMSEYAVYCNNCYDKVLANTKKAAIEAFNRLHEVKTCF